MRITVSVWKKTPVHTYLSMWVNGALAGNPGHVVLRNEEVEGFVLRLKPDEFNNPFRETILEVDEEGRVREGCNVHEDVGDRCECECGYCQVKHPSSIIR